MPDEHLTVRPGAGADADRRHREAAGDLLRDGRRHGLEHDREASGGLERERIGEEADGLVRRPALRLEAAEHRRRLRGQADVTHHRDARADDRRDAGQGRACALELDGVRAGLLDEADRVLERLGVRDLERAERHVGDHERPARTARHRARQHDHLVHRRGDGGVVAEDGHRRRVADEDEVGAGLVREAAGRRVVRRDHDDRLAARLHAGQLGDGELAGGGRAGCGGARACAHDSSSSGRLSIRRVVPTRTAAASVGGSNGARAT